MQLALTKFVSCWAMHSLNVHCNICLSVFTIAITQPVTHMPCTCTYAAKLLVTRSAESTMYPCTSFFTITYTWALLAEQKINHLMCTETHAESCEDYRITFSSLRQKKLMNIQLGVTCAYMANFCRFGHVCFVWPQGQGSKLKTVLYSMHGTAWYED